MEDQPREQPDSPGSESTAPYYVRHGTKIVCQRHDCMHYGNHPNCVLKPMDRNGECYYPRRRSESNLEGIQ